MAIEVGIGIGLCLVAPAAGYMSGKAARKFVDAFCREYERGESVPIGTKLLPPPLTMSAKFHRAAASATIAVMLAVPQADLVARPVGFIASMIALEAQKIDTSLPFDSQLYVKHALELKSMASRNWET